MEERSEENSPSGCRLSFCMWRWKDLRKSIHAHENKDWLGFFCQGTGKNEIEIQQEELGKNYIDGHKDMGTKCSNLNITKECSLEESLNK